MRAMNSFIKIKNTEFQNSKNMCVTCGIYGTPWSAPESVNVRLKTTSEKAKNDEKIGGKEMTASNFAMVECGNRHLFPLEMANKNRRKLSLTLFIFRTL